MLCIAASRNKTDGTISVVSPQDGIEFYIKENDLLSRNIKMGDFCKVKIKKNVPESYEFVAGGNQNMKVNVVEDSVEITGVTGILVEKLALFFETKEFGEVACLDEDLKSVGEPHRITISRLQTKDRVGVYSRYVWGAVSKEHKKTENKEITPRAPRFYYNRPEYTPTSTAGPSESRVLPPPRPLFKSRPNNVTNINRGNYYHDETIMKRAVITTIIPNRAKMNRGNDSIAFLWLLDDHLPAIFHFEKLLYKLRVGHFFDGRFVLNKSGWRCVKYENMLGNLIEGDVTSDNNIEFHITIHEFLPLNPLENRIAAETRHNLIGRIIDQFERLPEDCSAGVRIAVRQIKLEARQERCWVVHRVFQSKFIQTLSEFYDVWRIPGMRSLIRARCYRQYESLRSLLDTSENGGMANVISNIYKKTVDKEEVRVEVDSNEEDSKFGWTTMVTENVVEMIVFPRIHGQRMGTMKKTITDESVYETVENVTLGTLYQLELNDKKEVAKMWDCPQYMTLNEEGLFEFKFVSSGELLLTRNVAVVEPIGLPKAFGKLMFHLPNLPISKTKKVLATADFRLLEDDDAFMDHDLTVENNVCFLSVDNIKPLEDQTLPKSPKVRPEEEPVEPTIFTAKLERMERNAVFSLFRDVCTVLSDYEVVGMLERNGLDTRNLFDLTKKKNHN